MSATTDTVYTAGWATIDRVSPLATFDPNTSIGSAYWNLNNHLQVARGDIQVGGTLVSDATRASVLDVAGNLQPGIRVEMVKWINMLVSAYPIIAPAPGSNVSDSEPFLGGVLDGEIFGIPKKLLIAGAVAYFIFKD